MLPQLAGSGLAGTATTKDPEGLRLGWGQPNLASAAAGCGWLAGLDILISKQSRT